MSNTPLFYFLMSLQSMNALMGNLKICQVISPNAKARPKQKKAFVSTVTILDKEIILSQDAQKKKPSQERKPRKKAAPKEVAGKKVADKYATPTKAAPKKAVAAKPVAKRKPQNKRIVVSSKYIPVIALSNILDGLEITTKRPNPPREDVAKKKSDAEIRIVPSFLDK